MIRSYRRASQVATGFAALGLGIVALATSPNVNSDEPAADTDGLVRVDTRALDHLYVLPAADFAGYKFIRLDPAEVSFSERWDPNSNRSRSRARRMTDADIEQLRSEVAAEFEKSVTAELRSGGYAVVQRDGDDVLRVTPMIVNLYVSAPNTQTPGARTYVANTGHMTLAATARDSVTGELLARVIDTQQGRATGRMQLASSVSSWGDARQAFTRWARVLRTGLDDAKHSAVAAEGVSQKQAAGETEGTPR
jgi:Protein of unknown function (DUF3313)